MKRENITRAKTWRANHKEHVSRLIKSATRAFPPSEEDEPRPELWKGGSWKWLNEDVWCKTLDVKTGKPRRTKEEWLEMARELGRRVLKFLKSDDL